MLIILKIVHTLRKFMGDKERVAEAQELFDRLYVHPDISLALLDGRTKQLYDRTMVLAEEKKSVLSPMPASVLEQLARMPHLALGPGAIVKVRSEKPLKDYIPNPRHVMDCYQIVRTGVAVQQFSVVPVNQLVASVLEAYNKRIA